MVAGLLLGLGVVIESSNGAGRGVDGGGRFDELAGDELDVGDHLLFGEGGWTFHR